MLGDLDIADSRVANHAGHDAAAQISIRTSMAIIVAAALVEGLQSSREAEHVGGANEK